MNYLEHAIKLCHSEISKKKQAIRYAEKCIEAANKDLNKYIADWIKSDLFLDCVFEKKQIGLANSVIYISCNLGTIHFYSDVTEIFKDFGISLYSNVNILCDCKGPYTTRLYGLYDDIDKIYDFLIKKQNGTNKRN